MDMVGFKGLLGHLNPLQSQDVQVLHCPQSSTAISSLCPSWGFPSGLNICCRLWTKAQGFSQPFICKFISRENVNNFRPQCLSGTIFSLLAVGWRSSDVKMREMNERQVDPGIQEVTLLCQRLWWDRSWLLGTFMKSRLERAAFLFGRNLSFS